MDCTESLTILFMDELTVLPRAWLLHK